MSKYTAIVSSIESAQKLLELIEKRKKIYADSDFEINCNKLSKTEIVEKIIILYEDN